MIRRIGLMLTKGINKDMQVLSQQEFELLKLLQTSTKLKAQDFQSTEDYSSSCDLTLELLQKGYLYSSKPNAYFDDDPLRFDCLAANFHITIKTINTVVCYGHYDEYLKAQPSSISFSFLTFFIIAVAIGGSLGLIMLI